MCKFLRFPAPKGRPERTPSPLPLWSRQLLPALASTGGISRIPRLSPECWASLGNAKAGAQVGRLCRAKTAADILADMETRSHDSCPSCKHHCSHLHFPAAPHLPTQDQCHCSGCSSGLGISTKMRAIRPRASIPCQGEKVGCWSR